MHSGHISRSNVSPIIETLSVDIIDIKVLVTIFAIKKLNRCYVLSTEDVSQTTQFRMTLLQISSRSNVSQKSNSQD